MGETQDVRVWLAEPTDAAVIHRFIQDLATYEKEPNSARLSVEEVREHLFPSDGSTPHAYVVLAGSTSTSSEIPNVDRTVSIEPQAFALYYVAYSTWEGPFMHLEDLFVRETYRKQALGSHLLTHLAQVAVERGYARIEWSALDWNTPALEFYERKVKANRLSEWYAYRLTGEELKDVAQHSLLN